MASIEERVAVLEDEVARLKREAECKEEQMVPRWDLRFGAFRDDPLYDEAMQLGKDYRRSQPMPPDDHVSP
jgi:hypothetical protein